MKTKSILILFLVLFLTKSLVSQNPVWSLPPYYMDNLNNLTALPQIPVSAYNGSQAIRSHNSILDKNGNILFFIVDKLLYSNDGVAIQLLPFNTKMGNEIAIVPFVGDCEKYYIIYSELNDATGIFNTTPIYSVLNINDGGTFSISTPTPFTTIPNNGDFDWALQTFKNGFLSIAVTTENVDGERFLYMSLKSKIAIYKIDISGINYIGSHDKNFVGGMGRCEMEVVEMPNNYRIAYGERYIYNDQSNPPIRAWQTINYFDTYKNTGLLIPLSQNYTLYPEDNNEPITNKVYVKGLEFSPDGNDLYITHNNTTLSTSSIDKYTINSSNPPSPVANIPLNEATNFAYSQIEYKNGNLFFVCENRLATYNLSTGFWNNNAVPFNFTYSAIFPSDIDVKTYQLIDQIDGMDYNTMYDISVSVNANPSQSICLGQGVTLTASGASTYEWVDNNNPSVILSTNAVFTPQPIATTTYTVFGYNNGCDGQTSITITVNPLPNVNIDDVTLCSGDNFPVTLYSGFSKGYSFNWTNGGVTVGTATNLVVNNEGTYCVTVTRNSTGCSNTDCATVQYDPRLQYNSDFTLEVLNCNSTNPNFNVLATFPLLPTGLTFWWQVCEIDILGNEISCMTNNSAWWNIGTTQDFDPEYTFVKGHIYKITRGIWSVPDDCMPWQASTITNITCNATGKNSVYLSSRDKSVMQPTTSSIKNAEFTIYPNPTTGNFTANVEKFATGDLIQVLDYSGKVILEKNINTNRIELNIAEMANGLYFVKVISADGISMEKLIKN